MATVVKYEISLTVCFTYILTDSVVLHTIAGVNYPSLIKSTAYFKYLKTLSIYHR